MENSITVAIQALGVIGKDAETALPVLCSRSRSTEDIERSLQLAKSSSIISQEPDEGVRAYLRSIRLALASPDPDQRRRSLCTALQRLKHFQNDSELAIADLSQLLTSDVDPIVHLCAINVLQAMGVRAGAAVPALQAYVEKNDTSNATRGSTATRIVVSRARRIVRMLQDAQSMGSGLDKRVD